MLLDTFLFALLVTWLEKAFLAFGSFFILFVLGTVVGLRLALPTADRGWNLIGSSLFIVSVTLLVALVAYFFIFILLTEGPQG